MMITNDTKLTRKATTFIDGAKGYFEQHYTVLINDKDSGIFMIVVGNQGKNNTQRSFIFKGQGYDEMKDVFEAAGHKWARK